MASKNKEANRKYYNKNKASIRAYHKEYRSSEKGRRQSRDYHLRRDFNIDTAAYEKMYEAQGGVCFICKRPETRKSQNGNVYLLVVDHDHTCCNSNKKTCGKCIRKLLCHACNVVLGMAEDSPDRLRQAAFYLEQHRSESGGRQ